MTAITVLLAAENKLPNWKEVKTIVIPPTPFRITAGSISFDSSQSKERVKALPRKALLEGKRWQ